MSKLLFTAHVPENLKAKAHEISESEDFRIGCGWKKIAGLKDWFSYRLNNNYRLLKDYDGSCIVCNHDVYQKKIRSLKR